MVIRKRNLMDSRECYHLPVIQKFQPRGARLSDLTNIGLELQRELSNGARSAIRYPVRLPVRIISDGQESTGESENFSSSGALFRMSTPLPAGSAIQFLLEIPAGSLGSDQTAAIHGEGQVIRSYQENGQNYAAIVIHEYQFQ